MNNTLSGFEFTLCTSDGVGARVSNICGLTVEEEHLCIWTFNLGIPYLLPLDSIQSFTQLVYYVSRLRKKAWLSAYDINYIAAFLFQRLTGQEHAIITNIEIGKEEDYEEEYPDIQEEEN